MKQPVRGLARRWELTWQAHPDKVAVIDRDGTETTFGQLASAAKGLAESFPAPVVPSEIVALHLPNGTAWVAHYLALIASGRVCLPIDPHVPDSAAGSLAEELGAAFLISPGGRRQLDQVRSAPLGAHVIKLTSATTGAPRSHYFGEAEMEADGSQIIAGMRLLASDRHLAAVPFGHSYGLGNLVLPLILQGATLVCPESLWPRELQGLCGRHAITVLPLVPPLVRALAALPEEACLPDSVRLVISAGGTLVPEVAQAFAQTHGRLVHNFYGASETGGIAFDSEGSATSTGRSVGRPLPGVNVTFDEDGVLQVTSAAVGRHPPGMGGSANGFPGDTGFLSATGELVLEGRHDDVVKIAGRRISLQGIAKAIRNLPGVDDAVVITHLGGRSEPRLAAVVATPHPVPVLRTWAKEHLPRWQQPDIWRTCPAIPFNARGKVDRTALTQILNDL